MAAPNLQSPTTISGKTTYVSLANTSETTLLSNASSSGKAFRVAHITATNTSSAAVTITVKIYTAASGGTGYVVGASAMTVPVGAAIIVVGKENPVWIEEDRRMTVTAGTANAVDVVCSYEDIS